MPSDADRLAAYNAKRRFDVTPEPPGTLDEAGGGRFVVQLHRARALHYDVRFEADGVLVSWAVPKGPSYDPSVKRLAVHVEDHPVEYRTFEGTIPAAQYGAGAVIVWDEGTYRTRGPRSFAEAVAAGHVSVEIAGHKLRGGWSLTRTGERGGKEQWVMVKRHDATADPSLDIAAEAPASVRSGRGLDEVANDPGGATWMSNRAATPAAAAEPRPAGPDEVPSAMLATASELADVGGDGWQFERKLDGLRCIAVRDGARIELWSRNKLSFTTRFPAVVAALGRIPADRFTLDGELVAAGSQRFASIQSGEPAVLFAFDVLRLLGRDTTALPLADRQALLAQAVGANPPDGLSLVRPERGDAESLLARACADGWEGLVAKRIDSPYSPGRSAAWRKLKCVASQELVVGGWTEPTGARTGFGALLVGHHERPGGALRFAGRVGTGFDEATLRDISRRLRELEVSAPPFVDAGRVPGAHWVRPLLVAEVRFSEWTVDGRLRHPSFVALRDDKPAIEVVRDPAPTLRPASRRRAR